MNTSKHLWLLTSPIDEVEKAVILQALFYDEKTVGK